jgi:glutamate racemase
VGRKSLPAYFEYGFCRQVTFVNDTIECCQIEKSACPAQQSRAKQSMAGAHCFFAEEDTHMYILACNTADVNSNNAYYDGKT